MVTGRVCVWLCQSGSIRADSWRGCAPVGRFRLRVYVVTSGWGVGVYIATISTQLNKVVGVGWVPPSDVLFRCKERTEADWVHSPHSGAGSSMAAVTHLRSHLTLDPLSAERKQRKREMERMGARVTKGRPMGEKRSAGACPGSACLSLIVSLCWFTIILPAWLASSLQEKRVSVQDEDRFLYSPKHWSFDCWELVSCFCNALWSRFIGEKSNR